MSNKDHPVWDIYDQYRTARLNVKYSQVQLDYIKKWSLIIEIIIAISTSSSIAGLWLWDGIYGGYLWKIIGLIAAFLAILKPILKLPDKISKKEELLIGYKALNHDLEKISILISQHQKYDENLKKQFLDALDRKGELIRKDNNGKVNEKLRNKLEAEVIKALPISHFYIPRSEKNDQSKTASSQPTTTATS